MLLYHGSNGAVENPIIFNKNSLLDFGDGFYTTTNLSQAIEFSKKVVERRKEGIATVSHYFFNEQEAYNNCNLLKFDSVSDKWLDFVASNRTGNYNGVAHDFVYGPVANDDVFRTVALYLGGALDKENTLKQLKIKQLFNQLVFCSEKALSFLKFEKAEVTS